jgi:hypothetical protein
MQFVHGVYLVGFTQTSKQPANISRNGINQLEVCNGVVCFLWGTNWNFVYYLDEFQIVKFIMQDSLRDVQKSHVIAKPVGSHKSIQNHL